MDINLTVFLKKLGLEDVEKDSPQSTLGCVGLPYGRQYEYCVMAVLELSPLVRCLPLRCVLPLN